MLDLIVTGLVAVPAIQLAANIATWCFKQGAQAERNHQRSIIRSTRVELSAERSQQREIQRDLRRQLAEERRAAHQAHYEMLGEYWDTVEEMRKHSGDVLQQFQAIRDQNRQFLHSLALTPEQRAAIHECNDQLERGIQRLRAYRGPYLQYYCKEIHDAQIALKSHDFITPELPEPVLPDDYPFASELLEFDPDELGTFPLVDLGNRQRGRFITSSLDYIRPRGPLVGLIKKYKYDKENGFWVLSAAAGALAVDLSSGDAYRTTRSITIAERRVDYRVGWWEHSSGERLMIRLDAGVLSQRMWWAPWGTPLHVHIHATDYFLKSIRGGQSVAREHRYANWCIPCDAGADFWKAYDTAAKFSDKMLIRESGMGGDPKNASLILRLATGYEFPVEILPSSPAVRILPQSGTRLGLVQEANRNFLVFLLRGAMAHTGGARPETVAELYAAIEESFQEQRDLLRLAEADSLELKKYRAVLQAEFETARQRKLETVMFSDWRIPEEQRGQFVVKFQTDGQIPEGSAVRLTGEEDILGWCAAPEEGKKLVSVQILFEKRRAFREDSFPHEGKLEGVPVDRELQNKIDAIENFLSAAAMETRSADEQKAFSQLRRELLGQFAKETIVGVTNQQQMCSADLDQHQERAVGLVSGDGNCALQQNSPSLMKIVESGI